MQLPYVPVIDQRFLFSSLLSHLDFQIIFNDKSEIRSLSNTTRGIELSFEEIYNTVQKEAKLRFFGRHVRKFLQLG